MTSPKGSIKNTVAIDRSDIPLLTIENWRRWVLETCRNENGRVISLFGMREIPTSIRLYAILGIDSRGELRVAATDWLPSRAVASAVSREATLDTSNAVYPSLTKDLPEAHLFERELAEEFSVRPEGHPWLKPLRRGGDYPYYRMEGEEIHEVAVGPVHAGIIEPGHFRFQCHGEKVFHLEIRLGYQHRGVESMLASSNPSRRAVLAESIAGDTVIGHALAFAHAVEGLSARSVPQRAKRLRAIALEIERLANHAGDLGALAGDIGFLPGAAYFGRLRGEFLNLLMEMSGNRMGRSLVRPGGVLFDLSSGKVAEFKRRLAVARDDFKEISELFFSTSSVLARLEQTGVVGVETAKALGLVGPAARASNLLRDVRQDYPTGAYRFHFLPPVRLSTGDVYARARVRSIEGKRSLEFILEELESLPTDGIFHACGDPMPSSLAVSLVEGWRGEIAHIVLTGVEGTIERYKVVDPSFHNWKALEIAMRGGQISDFPLCNKSFNLSYAGHDL